MTVPVPASPVTVAVIVLSPQVAVSVLPTGAVRVRVQKRAVAVYVSPFSKISTSAVSLAALPLDACTV